MSAAERRSPSSRRVNRPAIDLQSQLQAGNSFIQSPRNQIPSIRSRTTVSRSPITGAKFHVAVQTLRITVRVFS